MAENYKHLYHQMKKMVEQYQDVIVPGLREQIEKRVEVVYCKDCIWRTHKTCCPLALSELTKKGENLPLDKDFCSYGERE